MLYVCISALLILKTTAGRLAINNTPPFYPTFPHDVADALFCCGSSQFYFPIACSAGGSGPITQNRASIWQIVAVAPESVGESPLREGQVGMKGSGPKCGD